MKAESKVADFPVSPSSVERQHQESRTCKVVETSATSARVYWFSCLLPEASHFKVDELPVIKQERGILRLLVIAGNLSHFGGDITVILLEHWKKQWDHILFVPGPYEYGKGTVCLGDDYCAMLQQQMGHEKFTVFLPGLTDSVLFRGPNVRVLGAPCWPVGDCTVYKEARVYEPVSNIETLSGSSLEKARMGIVNDCLYLGKQTAEKRLKRDVATLVVALREVEAVRAEETRIVVTYGCPDEQLSTEIKHNNPFRGTVALGSPAFYTYFGRHVDWWIHGAAGDSVRASMCASRVTTLCNLYTAIHHRHGDGFRERIEKAIHIKKKDSN